MEHCLRTLPRDGGSYILLVSLNRDISVKVGGLGFLKFDKGYYAYVGSARGGIAQRVCRHVRLNTSKVGRLRWHIDYLLVDEAASILAVVYITNIYIEHELAVNMHGRCCISPVARGFGSSDCSCPTHLFRIGSADPLMALVEVVDDLGHEPSIYIVPKASRSIRQ